MPTPIPNFDHLARRWRARDARVVLAALDASGLSLAEFARRTGVQMQRLRRWRSRLDAVSVRRSAAARPAAESVRLVELVLQPAPVVAQPPVAIAAPSPAPSVIEVVTAGGWQLRVPGELLGALVSALSAQSC